MTFQEFYAYWKDQPENQGKSFTYGSCLYDYMKQGYSDPEADYMVYSQVAGNLGIDYEKVEELPYRAIIEIPDLSEYDEIARALYLNEGQDE